jgi:hypothetical protein
MASTRKPKPPVRRIHSRTAVPPPPNVPGYLEVVSQFTVSVVAHQGNGTYAGKVTRVISQGKDRVHVLFENQGQEWLFIRNPRDKQRVLGRLVDHRKRVILDFPEADLADSYMARGWIDVVTLAYPLNDLQNCVPINGVCNSIPRRIM